MQDIVIMMNKIMIQSKSRRRRKKEQVLLKVKNKQHPLWFLLKNEILGGFSIILNPFDIVLHVDLHFHIKQYHVKFYVIL